MAQYTMTLTVDAARRESVEKKLRQAFGEEVPTHSVEKVKTPESRADRLSQAESSCDDARSIVEELRDELQNWLDSMPENLQSGQKAGEIQEAIDALELLQSDLENLDFGSVSFPGMY